MSVASFSESHKFFHCQESDDSGQHPHADNHVLHVVVSVFGVGVVVVFFVAVGVVGHVIVIVLAVMMMMLFFAVLVREHGVGNEVQEGVAEEAPGSETQKHLEESRVLVGVL